VVCLKPPERVQSFEEIHVCCADLRTSPPLLHKKPALETLFTAGHGGKIYIITLSGNRGKASLCKHVGNGANKFKTPARASPNGGLISRFQHQSFKLFSTIR
jgi:hypothetical protein